MGLIIDLNQEKENGITRLKEQESLHIEKTKELEKEKNGVHIELEEQKEKAELFQCAMNFHNIVVPTLVTIGVSGVGKSSLCNVLAGKKFNDKQFPINGTPSIIK